MKIKIMAGTVLAFALFAVSCKKELEPQDSAPSAEISTGAAAPQAVPEQPVNMSAQPSMPAPQPAQVPQPAPTAPGMNPPHGQPNHRCDIAVGAPLNSAPAQKAPTAVPAPVAKPAGTAPSNSVIIPSNTTGEPVAAGVNPPHGMPGHRCDIAVGAPLQ
ncbi:MAG TPA: hypothetical protein VFR70_05790 [Flavobacterium sp.]|nr:hypothetical protein [Flavobacterium sp.]